MKHNKTTSLKIFLLTCICCLLCFAKAHAQQPFNRFSLIKHDLETLSDSLATGLSESANFSVVNIPLHELLRGVAETHHLNVSIHPALNQRVTNNFKDVSVKDMLLFLCQEYDLNIRFLGSIMSFHPFEKPAPPALPYEEERLDITYSSANDKLSVNLNRDSLTIFSRQLTEISGKNVILAPGTENFIISSYIKEAPFEEALDKIAFAAKLILRTTEDGFYILEPQENTVEDLVATTEGGRTTRRSSALSSRNNTSGQRSTGMSQGSLLQVDLIPNGEDTLVSIEAVNMQLSQIIEEVSLQLKKDYLFYSPVEGTTSTYMQGISYDALLGYLLQATPYTYRNQQGVYLIGDRKQEGLRATELVKLQFRTVDSLEEVIPAEMKQGLEIKTFRELNGLILSGSQPQIDEVKDFLLAIDQPVPNILIEVIVANVRKGVGLQTGIQAFLSDSVPSTNGQVFPGLDVTLSSKSINNFIEMLDSKGFINLGRVTPKFYVNLQALEQNNLIDVRSTPKLSTLNGHEADLSIGQSRYFLEQTQNISGGVTPITSISQRFIQVEANLALHLTPVVSGDEHITLSIDAEFSNFIEPEQEGFPPGNATRKFISQIRVKNEEMIVLGGLEEVRKSKSGSGIPLLSRIPVLKWLFSSRSEQSSEDKLLVFIKPTIVY